MHGAPHHLPSSLSLTENQDLLLGHRRRRGDDRASRGRGKGARSAAGGERAERGEGLSGRGEGGERA